MSFTQDRTLHSMSVAQIMYEIALRIECDVSYADEMFYLGWVHDIGYQFTDNDSDHANVGGDFLREHGYKYWREVKNHGNPESKYHSRELDLLNFANMHVNLKGDTVSYLEKLCDICDECGQSSSITLKAKRMVEYLETKNFTKLSKVYSTSIGG